MHTAVDSDPISMGEALSANAHVKHISCCSALGEIQVKQEKYQDK